VSSNAVGQRIDQHRNVIDAAVAAGVASIAYTSVLHADTNKIGLAADHLATEDLLKASGLPFTLLRNSWYIENYTATLAQTLAQRVILGSAGTGRVAAATRADYAAAAATVLTSENHDGAVYELGSDHPFTMAELADTITKVTGTTVSYQDLPAGEHVAALVGVGLPEPVAEFLADADAGIARGDLDTTSRDLRRLIARPTTPLSDAIAAALTP
jgi:NAD(P)H dehydrogenase (quinone)